MSVGSRTHVCPLPLVRCPYRVHLHYLAQRLGQGPHYQGWSRNPPLADYPVVGLAVILSGYFLHISRRRYSDFWTLLTLRSVLECARNGVRVNLSITVNFALSLVGVIADIWTVWFRRYRKENFHDESLPLGKWSRRESKQNWV